MRLCSNLLILWKLVPHPVQMILTGAWETLSVSVLRATARYCPVGYCPTAYQ